MSHINARLAFVRMLLLLLFSSSSLVGQTLSDFSPKYGSPGDQITITGSGFTTGTIKVFFWNNVQAPISISSDTRIIVTGIPSGVATGPISVQRDSQTPVLSSTDFTVVGPGPYITGLSTTVGAVNDQLTVYGVHFSSPLAVTFNGTSTTGSLNQTDGTQFINLNVPNGATTGPFSVTTTAGTSTNAITFTVIGAGPYISGFSPQAGSAGSQFFIYGEHFSTVNAVQVNGTNVGFFFAQSDTQIMATNRTDVTTGRISVSSPQGSYTNSNYFYIVPIVINGFSPTNGVPGTTVTLTGQNFLGTTNVRFGGVSADFLPPTNNTTLQATVPLGAPSGLIRVATPGGVQLSATAFRIPPTLSGFAPAAGDVGTSVIVSGGNLNEGISAVQFNGVSAVFTNVQAGQLTAIVPPGAANGPITITTTNGTVTSSNNFFLPAGITGFSPAMGAPGTMVKITGSNFIGASAVNFNGQPAASFYVTNNSVIGAVVPAAVTTGLLTVTTPANTASSGSQFFYAPPAISGFSPAHGLPGTNVTISGANFLGATAVSFNGVAARFTPPTDNGTLQAIVPTNATTGPITVTAPAGTATSAAGFVIDFSSDLGVSLTASSDPIFVSSNLVYTIVVTNAGPFPAPNILLTNKLDPTVNLLSNSVPQEVLAGYSPLTNLPAGSSATITLTVVPQSAGMITDSVAVASGYPDPDLANNTALLATTVLPLPLLSIQLYSPTIVQVSWPSALTNFALEFKASLSDTNTAWSNDPAPTFLSGDQKHKLILEPIGSAPKYYRLKQ